MQPPQVRPRLGAQLLDELFPGVLVVPQCVGPAATEIQREHELTRNALIQRIPHRAGGQVRQQIGEPTTAHRDISAMEFGGQPVSNQGRRARG
ncbi:hypothetical protein EV192_1021032 [Actinocrispum wychmicini]|uniref:Uncharacterized protein n=1 Tax=Actinocrispum wychmicini TaxID=1213861 RepID=A0A4R2JV17_9PSEU|nr:hypothetical protein EV192_1021032 [Actinocrispum wychmicini]